MSKRKLFHATTSTRIIAGAVLLISLILFSLFPVSQYILDRFTDEVVRLTGGLEEDLDLTISYEHLSSDILSRVHIEGIQVHTGTAHRLIQIDSIEIDQPAVILLTRLLFTRSIPVQIRGLTISVDAHTEQMLLAAVDSYSTSRADSSSSLRATVSIEDGSITWNGDVYTGTAEVPWLSAGIRKAQLSRLQAQINVLEAQGNGASGKLRDIYVSYLPGENSGQLDISATEGSIQVPGYVSDAAVKNLSVSYRTKDEMFTVSLYEASGTAALSSHEFRMIPETQFALSSVTVNGQGGFTQNLKGTIESSGLSCITDTAHFTADLLSITGASDPLQISFSAPSGFIVDIDDEQTVQGGDTSFSILSSSDELRIYTFSDSLIVSAGLMNRVYPEIAVNRFRIDNPSVYGRYVRSEDSSEWEADGDLSVDLVSPIQTSVSALVFADARLSHSRTEQPVSVDSLTVHGKNIASDLIDDLLDGVVTYSHRSAAQTLSASLSDGNQLYLRYLNSREEPGQSLYVNAQELVLDEYQQIIGLFAPDLLLYTTPESSLTGDFRGSWDPGFQYIEVNTSLAVKNIRISDVNINAAATLLLEGTEETFIIPSATVTTEGLRVAFSGEIDRLSLFPRGTLEASNVNSGKPYATAVFSQSAQRVFGYSVRSSYLQSFNAEGTLRRIGDDLISTTGDLRLFQQTRPYIASLYLDTRTLEGSMPRLQVRVKVDQETASLSGSFNASGFLVPQEIIKGLNSPFRLDTQIEGFYSFPDAQYGLSSSSFALSDLSFLNIEQGKIDLAFDLNTQSLAINEISWKDEFGALAGNARYEVSDTELFSTLRHSDTFLSVLLSGGQESLEVLLLPSQSDSANPFSIQVSSFNLRRLYPFTEDVYASVNAYGVSDFTAKIEAEGKVSVDFGDDQRSLSSSVSVDSNRFSFYDGIYSNGSNSVSDGFLSYDTGGSLSVGALFRNDKRTLYRDASTTSRIEAFTSLPPAPDLFEGFADLIQAVRSRDFPDTTVSLHDTSLFNMLTVQDSDHLISIDGDILTVTKGSGGFLDLEYHLDTGEVTVSADESFLWPMEGRGYAFRDFISLDFSHIEFDFTHINALFVDPSIRFDSGTLSGSVLIEGDPFNPGYYGMMHGSDLSLSLFWLPDTVLTVENPVVTLDTRTFTLPYTSTYARGKNRAPATGVFSMTAEFAGWLPDSYVIDAEIETGTIPLYIPITNIDMLIQGEARGVFSLEGTLKNETLRGDIIAPSASISFGIPELPEWYIPRARTSGEFTFTSGKNVTFVYPDAEAPIVSATVQDAQTLSVSFTAPEMTYGFSGDIALRSGEIYYVQENFYITEGNISFNENPPGSLEEVLPRVNLRARLRKYDEDRERIDIYLILQNSLLTAIDPRFESIPTRTDNEILQLLGQNLLTSGSDSMSDAGFQSVLNAATAATDVITRFGLIQGNTISFGFSSIIREALGLDVFTIRSNLLQNILLDAIPGAIDNENTSPFGRYLDNTTFYLGKYLADELYLQGLISMQRDATGSQSSFLAPDLTLDTELSVEWLNPLATFSVFTQPTELSLFNIFDTMGFSVTKSIEF
ncbi:MAG: hypothetical protein JXK93_11340 [Sphaerochaetaceae bacterium]|nr:hypothetical protein [Sphaerochaetaceae bacterium]